MIKVTPAALNSNHCGSYTKRYRSFPIQKYVIWKRLDKVKHRRVGWSRADPNGVPTSYSSAALRIKPTAHLRTPTGLCQLRKMLYELFTCATSARFTKIQLGSGHTFPVLLIKTLWLEQISDSSRYPSRLTRG